MKNGATINDDIGIVQLKVEIISYVEPSQLIKSEVNVPLRFWIKI